MLFIQAAHVLGQKQVQTLLSKLANAKTDPGTSVLLITGESYFQIFCQIP